MLEKEMAAKVLTHVYDEWQRILSMYRESLKVQIGFPEDFAVRSMAETGTADWHEKRTCLLREEAKRLEMKFYCIQYAYRMISLFENEEINNMEMLRKLADKAVEKANGSQSKRTGG